MSETNTWDLRGEVEPEESNEPTEEEMRVYEARLRFLERQDERRQNWRKKRGWASR